MALSLPMSFGSCMAAPVGARFRKVPPESPNSWTTCKPCPRSTIRPSFKPWAAPRKPSSPAGSVSASPHFSPSLLPQWGKEAEDATIVPSVPISAHSAPPLLCGKHRATCSSAKYEKLIPSLSRWHAGRPTSFPANSVSAGLGKVVSRSSPKRRSPSKGFFGHRRIGSGFPSTSPVTAKTAVEIQIHFRSSPGWRGLPKRFSGFGALSADFRVVGGGPGVHRRGRGGPQRRKTDGRRVSKALWGSSPVWQASGS